MRERREEVAVLCATLRALSPDLLPVGKEEELLWALEVASSRAIGETNMNGTAATMASPVTPAPAAGELTALEQVPWHDMFNHDGDARLSLHYNSVGMSYSFSTPNRPWSKGEEVPPCRLSRLLSCPAFFSLSRRL